MPLTKAMCQVFCIPDFLNNIKVGSLRMPNIAPLHYGQTFNINNILFGDLGNMGSIVKTLTKQQLLLYGLSFELYFLIS